MCFKETLPSLNDLEPCKSRGPGSLSAVPGPLPEPRFSSSGSSGAGSVQALRSNPHNLFEVTDGLPNQCIHTIKPGAGQTHSNSLLKFRPISIELRR